MNKEKNTTLDLSKTPFPQSVIMTKRTLDKTKEEKIEIITDSTISKNKITEYLNKNEWETSTEPQEKKYKITATKKPKN
ncbi:MAG: sulfurtransferase TusA family protein [Synergistaceae bacterium]